MTGALEGTSLDPAALAEPCGAPVRDLEAVHYNLTCVLPVGHEGKHHAHLWHNYSSDVTLDACSCGEPAPPLDDTPGIGIAPMTFGEALEQLKSGWRVARTGWNGRGMWIAFWRAGTYSAGSELFENCRAAKAYAASCANHSADVASSIVMKAADGSLVFGWFASQVDLLAEDWYVVP